jgi:DNA photolyase
MPSRAVVWFRRDLRVADHPALLAALDAADQVVPVFVVDRILLRDRPSGPNRRAFLHGALQALSRDLEALGGRLLVREGDPVRIYSPFARAAKAAAWDDPSPPRPRCQCQPSSAPGGLWTAGSPNSGDRLRSPPGGPVAAPPGSRAPGGSGAGPGGLGATATGWGGRRRDREGSTWTGPWRSLRPTRERR